MTNSMKHHLIREKLTYTGKQLRSHWIMDQTGVLGDSIVSFQGPADVPVTNMVDLIDVREEAPIASKLMLHFIVEHFGISLENAVLRQRLLIAILGEELRKYPKTKNLERRGDDLYDGSKKLSVSIATASPISCCIHVGLNVDSEGTPVPTVGLADYDIDSTRFATNVMKRYVNENSQINIARCKVKPIP